MRSSQLDLEKYGSDKITSHLLQDYDLVFDALFEKDVKLLELGVYMGESLLLWKDYFPTGTIVGVDISIPKHFPQQERISLFEGSQTDKIFLSEVASKTAPEGFDIIIDDASHIGEYTKQSFWHLFENHLKPGGLYVIEDWLTAYFPGNPDSSRFKAKDGFLSKMRSGLQPQMNFFIKAPFLIERSLLEKNPTRSSYINGILHRSLFKILKILEKLNLTSIKTGLLPLHNLLLKMPYRSHHYGMAGVVKQLVDWQAIGILSRGSGSLSARSEFSRMIITPRTVIIYKAIDQL